jgi:pyruvate dehydrogenase E2 component (dihydrolipoamide acetyltransferase)
MTPVEVPKVGNTVEEVMIGEWRKHKGDRVTADEVIVEIETDKTTFEITAPVSGTLLEVFFEQGALVPVFTKLCVIGEAGEDAAAVGPASADRAPEPAPSPVALPGPSPAAGAPDAVPPSAALSPRARRFAQEHSFTPPPLAGSGPGGRVLEADVRGAYTAAPAATAPSPERVSNIRETIARRMRESLSTTAQYTMHTSAGATGLLALRARCKASPGLTGITIGDMVLFCVTKALAEAPALNAEFIDGRILRHADINLGFACDTDRGLFVPVVKQCQKLSLAELSARVGQLAEQAIRGTISTDDMRGATFTVSNLGNLGIESFTPILDPPQVAILGVDAIQLKPVRRDGGVAIVDSIGLSITCDHQVIDGAPGARFLQIVARKIEQVESLYATGN